MAIKQQLCFIVNMRDMNVDEIKTGENAIRFDTKHSTQTSGRMTAKSIIIK